MRFRPIDILFYATEIKVRWYFIAGAAFLVGLGMTDPTCCYPQYDDEYPLWVVDRW